MFLGLRGVQMCCQPNIFFVLFDTAKLFIILKEQFQNHNNMHQKTRAPSVQTVIYKELIDKT